MNGITVGHLMNVLGFEIDEQSMQNAENGLLGLKNTATKLLGAIGIGLSLTGIKNAIQETVALSSEVQEMENKFNVVFDHLSQEVDLWAQNYADAIGRNKNDIKTYLADQQNLLVGFGMTREEGAKLSEEMVTLALDLASFANIDESYAVHNLSKALMGETESAKNLGAVLNDSTRAEAMHALGLSGTYEKLSQLQKMQVNYQAILSQSPDAIGDCERSLGSYASTMRSYEAKLKELKTLIGQFFMPTAQKVLSYGAKGLTMLRDIVRQINDFADRVGGAERIIKTLAAAGIALFTIFNFSKLTTAASGFLKILTAINLKSLAVTAIVLGLVLLVQDFISFMRGDNSVIGDVFAKAGIDAEGFRDKVLTTWSNIKDAASSTISSITTGFQNAATWMKEHQGLLKGIAAAVGILTIAIIANNAANKIRDLGGMARIGWMLAMRASVLANSVVLGAHTAATWLATAASSAFGAVMAFITSPITLVVLAIGALIAIIYLLVKNWDTVKEKGLQVWEMIQSAWGAAGEWFETNVAEPVEEAFSSIVESLSEFPDNALQWGKDLVDKLIEGIKSKIEGIKNLAGEIGGFFSDLFDFGDDDPNSPQGPSPSGFESPDNDVDPRYPNTNPNPQRPASYASNRRTEESPSTKVVISHEAQSLKMPVAEFDFSPYAKQLQNSLEVTASANIVKPYTISNATNSNSGNRNITQNIEINNEFNGDQAGQEKSHVAMEKASNDATSEMARALTYTR